MTLVSGFLFVDNIFHESSFVIDTTDSCCFNIWHYGNYSGHRYSIHYAVNALCLIVMCKIIFGWSAEEKIRKHICDIASKIESMKNDYEYKPIGCYMSGRDWCIKFATHKSPIYDPF